MATKKKTIKRVRANSKTKPRAVKQKATRASKASSVAARTTLSLNSLQKINLIAGGLYIIQAALILFFANNSTLSVTTQYLTTDSLLQTSGNSQLVPAFRYLADINVSFLIAGFLSVAAVMHILAATFLRRSYENSLARGTNPIRWYGFSMSAGLLMVTVALLVGIQDIASLIMIFGLMIIANITALVTEARPSSRRLGVIVGGLASLLPWLAIALYVVHTRVYGDVVLSGYVYALIGSLFVLMAVLASNFYLHYKKVSKWSNYLFVETAVLVTSFVLKTAVAWQIFVGIL